jgi:hypothetical protein
MMSPHGRRATTGIDSDGSGIAGAGAETDVNGCAFGSGLDGARGGIAGARLGAAFGIGARA